MFDVRFTALAAGLFTLSYAGVAWLMAGTPLASFPHEFPVRLASLSSATAPAAPTLPGQPPAVQSAALPAGDGHPDRDRLRVAALRASAAYVDTPCDAAAKAAMVEAVGAYAKAWADMMDCGPQGCDYRKINLTAAVFSTPLDIRLRDAVGAAFDKHGISIDDFPAPLRINVAMLVRGRGTPATACPQQRAQILR